MIVIHHIRMKDVTRPARLDKRLVTAPRKCPGGNQPANTSTSGFSRRLSITSRRGSALAHDPSVSLIVVKVDVFAHEELAGVVVEKTHDTLLLPSISVSIVHSESSSWSRSGSLHETCCTYRCPTSGGSNMEDFSDELDPLRKLGEAQPY